MGEYAIRKSDGTRVKIGTCEEMYYLRYEDRFKVAHQQGNVDPVKDAESLRFRLPFPDEDDMQPGRYEDYNRGARLYRPSPVQGGGADFSDSSKIEDAGSMQLSHECGLLVNVPCYHGEKLPEVVKPMTAFWNGRGWFYELVRLRPTPGGVKPIVRCRCCGNQWRYTWADIWEYINDELLRAALRPYMEHEQKQTQAEVQ